MSKDRDLTSAEQIEISLRAGTLAKVVLGLLGARTTWDIRMRAGFVMDELAAICDWGEGLVGGEPKKAPIHGFTCEKKPHPKTGALHGSQEDGPYDVDGCKYCGRCHQAL